MRVPETAISSRVPSPPFNPRLFGEFTPRTNSGLPPALRPPTEIQLRELLRPTIPSTSFLSSTLRALPVPPGSSSRPGCLAVGLFLLVILSCQPRPDIPLLSFLQSSGSPQPPHFQQTHFLTQTTTPDRPLIERALIFLLLLRLIASKLHPPFHPRVRADLSFPADDCFCQ